MLTLTRRIGERILIGEITVEVVGVDRNGVTLRLHDVDESAVDLVDTPTPPRPTSFRHRIAPPRREETPLIIETRRSRKSP